VLTLDGRQGPLAVWGKCGATPLPSLATSGPTKKRAKKADTAATLILGEWGQVILTIAPVG
jgi:hypothetical protein